MDKEIMKMAEQLKTLSNVAVLQYTNIVNDILDEKITDELEIAFILDGMLDFCQFDEMLLLFKRVCRGLYLKSTSSAPACPRTEPPGASR